MHRFLQRLTFKAVVSLIELAINAAPHCIPVPDTRFGVDILRQPTHGREIRDVVHLPVRTEVFGFSEVLK